MKISTRSVAKSGMFHAIFLALLWTVSLICGGFLAVNDPSVVFLMRSAPYSQVSIVGLIYAIFLPITVSLVFNRRFHRLWIYVLSALRAFLTGYILLGISYAYGDSGWLVCGLSLFSCTTVNILLVYIWSGILLTNHRRSGTEFIFSMLLGFVFGTLDYAIISPFLTNLLRNI